MNFLKGSELPEPNAFRVAADDTRSQGSKLPSNALQPSELRVV